MIIDWGCEEAKGKDYCFINKSSGTMFFQKHALPPSAAYFWTLHERPKAEQMKENKNEIPYGATHIGSDNLYYQKNECKNWFYYDCGSGVFLYSKKSWQFHETLEPIEQMKETFYTKEMYEAGELPTVGMKLYAAERGAQVVFSEVEIISMSAGNNPVITFLRDLRCECMFWHDGSSFKPLDKRTDREKAIDDLSIVIENYNKSSVELKSGFSLAEWLLNDINDNQIHGITFTGDK